MIINWIDVTDSKRVAAIAYDAEQDTIYVRFKRDGVEYWYGSCPPHIWEQFTAPGVSKGEFIGQVLDGHPKGRYLG